MARLRSLKGLILGGGGLYAAERLEALKRTAAGYSRTSKPYQVCCNRLLCSSEPWANSCPSLGVRKRLLCIEKSFDSKV